MVVARIVTAQFVSLFILLLRGRCQEDQATELSLRLNTSGCDPSLQASGNCAGIEPTYSDISSFPLPTNEQQCTNISPSQQYNCEWYKERGACEELEEQYCSITCGKCCFDKPFPGISCEFVKDNLCDDPEVVQNRYCELSCGICSLPVQGIAYSSPNLTVGSSPFQPNLIPSAQSQGSLSEAEVVKKFFANSMDIQPVQSLTGDDACDWEQVECNSEGNIVQLNFKSFTFRYWDSVNTIPPEISLLQFLETIDFYHNNFVGTIPPEVSVLTRLYKLYLPYNDFTRTLPKELFSLTRLQEIDFRDSKFTGTMPKELSLLTQLDRIDFSWDNQISGPVPQELSVLSYLGSFNFNGNKLSGTLPKELSEMKSLHHFYIKNNYITGTLPVEYSIWGQNSVSTVLSQNKLTGTIPMQYSEFSNLLLFPQYGENVFCVSEFTPNVQAFGNEPQIC